MTLTTSLFHVFTGDNMIPKETIKLAVTLVEPPRTTTMMIDFLVVKCPSAFNGVLGRPLLKALKAVTSIHYQIIKFPTAARIGQVRGRQHDSKKC